MAVPDIVRNVTRNVREALSSREGFKEKAKDLPLYVLQSALSGVGQALLLGDRMRTTIKRIAGQDADTEETHPKTADEITKDEKAEEKVAEKPARREPVIFAPRPESASPKEDRSEANGAKPRPEPVIFAPAKPKAATGPAPAAPEAKPTGSEPAKTAETEAAETKPAVAEATEAKATEAKATETKPAVAEATEAEATEAAKPETEPAETGIPAPAAVGVEVTEVKTAKPEAADAALVEVTETKVATPVAEPVGAVTVPAEPMPGYGQLTVASLRARMRGKTAEQIREFLAYERATTVRAEVVRMYENRLAKLEAAE
ncbi:hypothetical protein ACFV0L_42995 [Streptosporangium canum]|uniref:hypothetical protein n=1 Tax=Streptosporangium canum TaxID=324952 RepID=UPI003697BCF3